MSVCYVRSDNTGFELKCSQCHVSHKLVALRVSPLALCVCNIVRVSPMYVSVYYMPYIPYCMCLTNVCVCIYAIYTILYVSHQCLCLYNICHINVQRVSLLTVCVCRCCIYYWEFSIFSLCICMVYCHCGCSLWGWTLGVWGELSCRKRLFNPLPRFSRLGTWCPTFLCANALFVLCVCTWVEDGFLFSMAINILFHNIMP